MCQLGDYFLVQVLFITFSHLFIVVVDRVPSKDYHKLALEGGISAFAFPNGAKVIMVEDKSLVPLPKWSCFVLTDSK